MSSALHKFRVAFSVTNCICNDQRVLKMAGTVSKLNCDIHIIGRKTGDCCNNDTVPFRTRRFRMIFRRGFFFYMFFNLRLFIYLLFHRFDLLVSNDLDTLLPNFLVSRLKSLPLVYDSHEYFTGVPEIQNRLLVKWVWKSIEKMIFPHLRHILTVSDSIAVQYEKEYGIKPLVVRNCSGNADNIVPYSRAELGINADNFLLILQGAGINRDRGGEELISAISGTANTSLLIVGSGDMLAVLKSNVIASGISDRVKFFPKVPWNEMMRYTKSADAGLSLDKNSNLNYEFSLPNKLFDYIAAGIPVVASDLPETGKIIRENKCGLIIDKVTPEDISNAISELKNNQVLLSELRSNAGIASEKINWETESEKVKDFYNKLLICG